MNGFGTILKDYLAFNKISQKDFANRLNITFKHMNELLNENTEISVDLMIAISLLTDIDANLILETENKKRMYLYLNKKFKTEDEIKKYLESFYIKEMYKLGWIDLKDKTSYITNAINLLEYLNLRNFDMFENYFENKISYNKETLTDRKQAFVWINRCDKLAIRQEVKPYNSKNLEPLFEELKKLSNKESNINDIIKIMNKSGIYLVLEEPLKNKNIKSCCQVKGTNPAIYLNKNIHDKAELYYSLYYELSHIKTEYNKLKKIIMLTSFKDTNEKDESFALNKMVDNKTSQKIKNDIYNIEVICKKNNIPLAFAHFRLNKDKIIINKNKYQEII